MESPSSALSKPVYLGNVSCSGQELTIFECGYELNTKTSESDHSKDVGIECKYCKYYVHTCILHYSQKTVTIMHYYIT